MASIMSAPSQGTTTLDLSDPKLALNPEKLLKFCDKTNILIGVLVNIYKEFAELSWTNNVAAIDVAIGGCSGKIYYLSSIIQNTRMI